MNKVESTGIFKNCITALSDTEIIAIAQELGNPNVRKRSIIEQLVKKGDENLYNEVIQIVKANGMANVINSLLITMNQELSNRLFEKNMLHSNATF